jgi:hypothetical protein
MKLLLYIFHFVIFFSLITPAFAGDCVSCDSNHSTEAFASNKQIWQLKDILEQVNLEVNRCSYTNSSRRPKNIIFLFEGYKGFSKELLIGFRKFQSLKPKCEKNKDGKFIFKFPNQSWIEADQAKGRFDDFVKTGGGTPVGLKNFIIEGFCKSPGIDFSNTEIFYYGQEEGVDEAVKCARQMAQMQYSKGVYPTVSVLGFSRGGARAIEFAQELRKQNIKIDSAMTVDPVPTDFLGTAAKIPLAVSGIGVPSHSPSNFIIPVNVDWVNYWQESDNRWNGPLSKMTNHNSGLHGSPVLGASVNKLIIPPADKDKYPNGAHWRIFNNDEIKSSVQNLYNKIQALPSKDKCFD